MTTNLVTSTPISQPKPTTLPIVRLRGLAPMALTYLIAQILVASQARGEKPALLSRNLIPTKTLRGYGVDLNRMLSWESDAASLPSIVKRVLQSAAIHPMHTIILSDHAELDRTTEEQITNAGITLIYA